MHRVVALDQLAYDGVTSFVPGGRAAFTLAHHHGATFGAHQDFVLGELEVLHRDRLFVLTSRQEGGFVDQILQISTDEAGRAGGDDAELNVTRERHLLGVHREDAFTTADVRAGHGDAAIEASGAQDGRIEHVRTIGGRDDDHALVGLEAIHLDQQLVQRLLALVVTTAEACAAVTTDRVDLVDEDDAGRVLFALLE